MDTRRWRVKEKFFAKFYHRCLAVSEIYPYIGCSYLDMAMCGLRMVNQKLGVIFRKIYLLNIPSILDFPKFCLTQFFQLAHFSVLPWRGASRASVCRAILNFFLNFLKELAKIDIFIHLSLLRWPFRGCGGGRGGGLWGVSKAESSACEVYPAGKLQWQFTCGFDFRHSL